MLKALVITLNPNTNEIGALLAIARSEARKREKSKENPPIRSLRFFSELNVYLAVYEVEGIPKQNLQQRRERTGEAT